MVIGLTGGIGSGKSTVAKLAAEMTDAYLILTDDLAKNLMEKGKKAYNNVVKEFGKEVLDADENIDRKKLSTIVFADEKKLKKLNACTHPEVISETLRLVDEKKKEKVPFIIIESALLKSAGMDKMCESLWYVWTDEEIRRERLKINRGYSDKKIDSIFLSQNSYRNIDNVKAEFDYVIENNKDINVLKENLKYIIEIFEKSMEEAK